MAKVPSIRVSSFQCASLQLATLLSLPHKVHKSGNILALNSFCQGQRGKLSSNLSEMESGGPWYLASTLSIMARQDEQGKYTMAIWYPFHHQPLSRDQRVPYHCLHCEWKLTFNCRRRAAREANKTKLENHRHAQFVWLCKWGATEGARRCGMEISSISVDDDALAKQSPHWNSPIASVKWMTHSQRDRHRENSGAIRLLLIRMEKFFTGCSCFQKENLKVKKKNSCFLLKKAHLWSALRLKTNLLDLPYNLYRFLGVWLELFQYLSYKACI